MSLGDRFVDGSSVEWGGVGRAVAGSAISGIILAIISFIDGVRALFVGLLDGIARWSSEFIPALIVPTGLDQAWLGAGESLQGLGPIGFVVAILIVSGSIWIGVTALIWVSGRILP